MIFATLLELARKVCRGEIPTVEEFETAEIEREVANHEPVLA